MSEDRGGGGEGQPGSPQQDVFEEEFEWPILPPDDLELDNEGLLTNQVCGIFSSWGPQIEQEQLFKFNYFEF